MSLTIEQAGQPISAAGLFSRTFRSLTGIVRTELEGDVPFIRRKAAAIGDKVRSGITGAVFIAGYKVLDVQRHYGSVGEALLQQARKEAGQRAADVYGFAKNNPGKAIRRTLTFGSVLVAACSPTPAISPTVATEPARNGQEVEEATATPSPTSTAEPTKTPEPTATPTPEIPKLSVVWTSPLDLGVTGNAYNLEVNNPSWSVVNNEGGTIKVENDPEMGLVYHSIIDPKYPKITAAQRVYATKWVKEVVGQGIPLKPPYGLQFKVKFNEKSLGLNAPNVVISLFNKYKNEKGSYDTLNLKLRPLSDGKTRFYLAPKLPNGGELGQYYIQDVIVEAGKVYDVKILVSGGQAYVLINDEFKKSIPFEETLGGFHTGAYSSDGSLPDGAEQWYTPVKVLR